MKVLIFLLFALMTIINSSDTNTQNKMKAYDITQEENKSITVSVKEKFTVSLPGNPSTGYLWNYSKNENSILKLTSSTYEQNKAPQGYVGVPGIYYFTFESENKGKEEIKFVYKRSWENSSSDRTEKAIITVN